MFNSYLMGVGPYRNSKSPGKSKIGQFDVALSVNEEILRLEVSVQHPVAVAVRNTL